jgi:tRNA-binding protein
MQIKPLITWADFEKLDIRTGTIIDAIPFEKAHKPAYKIYIDFGDFGIRKTSAQITELYDTKDLIGNQVICLINLPPKQIADFKSECLIMGVYTKKGVVILSTEQRAGDGLPIG